MCALLRARQLLLAPEASWAAASQLYCPASLLQPWQQGSEPLLSEPAAWHKQLMAQGPQTEPDAWSALFAAWLQALRRAAATATTARQLVT
jgi:hypothetical protein